MREQHDAFGRWLMDRPCGREIYWIMERDDGFVNGDDDGTRYFGTSRLVLLTSWSFARRDE